MIPIFPGKQVNLSFCALGELNELKFAHGAEVIMGNVKTFPSVVDVSRCSDVYLDGSHLDYVEPFKFADNACVSLRNVKNLNPQTDFSKCLCVDLTWAEFEAYKFFYPKTMYFKKGANVKLHMVSNLPKNFNMMYCRYVDLSSCDLHNLCELRFGHGADVSLCRAENLPPIVDVSGCAEVDLEKADWHRTEKLIFRDRKQMEECSSLTLPENWKGQVLFKDEMQEDLEKYQSGQNRNLELSMLKDKGR